MSSPSSTVVFVECRYHICKLCILTAACPTEVAHDSAKICNLCIFVAICWCFRKSWRRRQVSWKRHRRFSTQHRQNARISPFSLTLPPESRSVIRHPTPWLLVLCDLATCLYLWTMCVIWVPANCLSKCTNDVYEKRLTYVVENVRLCLPLNVAAVSFVGTSASGDGFAGGQNGE